MSWSLAGNGVFVLGVRVKRSRPGPAFSMSDAGSQRVAGAIVEGGENLRGPTRRSYSAAIEFRQLPAATSRSASLRGNWTSFSASAKVEIETAGPTSGAVPKAGGAPGVGIAEEPLELGAGLRHAAITVLVTATAARLKNPLRVFDMFKLSDAPCRTPPSNPTTTPAYTSASSTGVRALAILEWLADRRRRSANALRRRDAGCGDEWTNRP